ncbi:MAG: protein kinase, partial [Gemmatimonadaceae bacterium]
VMPFIDGESLRQRLDREGALPMGSVLAIGHDVAEALDAAHAMGVVHRDIKPQNILLRGGHALVADFGIALALEATGDQRVTELGVAVGTPMYMSPEQASASSRIDGRSDVYSLGCVVYEMLAGEAPYPSITPHAVRAKHLHAPVPDLAILRPAVPQVIPGVLARALAKVPAERFSTAGEFIAELTKASVSGEASVSAQPKLRAGHRRAAVLLVLILGSLGVWRLAQRQGRVPVVPPAVAITEADRTRIAVLYFDNVSSDAEIGHIADGLTEDLIDELSQVRGLHLISPNGVRPFREKPPPIDSIARALEVGTVVGGSVSASDKVVRATVRLLDPRTGEQLDTRSIELPREEALGLRQAVVLQVATFLRQRLGQEVRLGEQRQQTRSLAAWESAKRADELSREGAVASNQFREGDARDLLQRADSLYQAAQRLDPSWTAPTIGRGWVALRLSLVASLSGAPDSLIAGRGVTPSQVMTERAIAFANAALKGSGESAKALALRGYARQWLGTFADIAAPETMLRQAEADLRAALDERPNDARSWYALGEVFFADGRFPEASAALHSAYEGDAYLTEVRDVVGLLFFVSLNTESFDEARRWCVLGQARYTEDPRFATCQFLLLGWTGKTTRDVSEAWQQIAPLERGEFAPAFASQWGYFRLLTAAIAARAGMADSARAIVRAVRAGVSAQPSRERALDADAYVQLLLGERDEAARLLAELLRVKPQLRGQLVRSPWFRDLVADPRFGTMLRTAPAPP